jgi:hypothetical protein
MSNDFSSGRSVVFGEIRRPRRRTYDARAGLLAPDGGEGYVRAQDAAYCAENNMESAAQFAALSASDISQLNRELSVVERKLAWTPPTITTPKQGVSLSGSTRAAAVVLCAAAATCMAVGNVVLSDYALNSSNDVMGNSRLTAFLVACMPAMGAIALKVWEQRLVSPDARWFYGLGVFAVGICSLVVWLVAAGLAFGPDTGGALSLVTSDGNSRLVGMVLVVTTVLCDMTLGCTLLSGVGYLLSASYACETIPNPTFEALMSEKSRLTQCIDEAQQRRIKAEDYLSRAAAGRELTRREAEADLNRARELWTQAQTAALAFAIAVFLSVEEEDQ